MTAKVTSTTSRSADAREAITDLTEQLKFSPSPRERLEIARSIQWWIEYLTDSQERIHLRALVYETEEAALLTLFAEQLGCPGNLALATYVQQLERRITALENPS